MPPKRLNVFLCHSSQDKPAVRELYDRLLAEGWIDPWLDKAKILPGEDWRIVIEKAVEESDLVVVCLSNHSVNKEGFVQKEIRYASDVALEKPEGTIFLIPIRLEECVVPRGLRTLQWVDYFGKDKDENYKNLLEAMKRRAESLGIEVIDAEALARQQAEERAHKEFQERIEREAREKVRREMEERLRAEAEERARKELEEQQARCKEERKPIIEIPKLTEIAMPPDKITISNGMEFMRVVAGKFSMGSNDGYDSEKPQHAVNLPYNFWMGRFTATNAQYSQFKKIDFVEGKENYPIVVASWYDAQKYVKWMNEKFISQLPQGYIFRLPSEAEWEKAARGVDGRIYPWGNKFDKNKCNSSEGGKNDTTPVGFYSPRGNSVYGCADMAGNVWEWTRSLWGTDWYIPDYVYPYKANDGREDEHKIDLRVLRGGSFDGLSHHARCAFRNGCGPGAGYRYGGFRIVVSPLTEPL